MQDLGSRLKSLTIHADQRPERASAGPRLTVPAALMLFVAGAIAGIAAVWFGHAKLTALPLPAAVRPAPAAKSPSAGADTPAARIHPPTSAAATNRPDASAGSPDIAPTPLPAVKPAEANAPRETVLIATGKIVSDHLVNVSTKVSGQIVRVDFEQGDKVEAGQVIALVEDVIYAAFLAQAKANVARAEANLASAEWEFNRVRRLFEATTAPDHEFQRAKFAYDANRAQLEADRALLQQAQQRYDDCTVRAPISGVILERNVEVGDFVAAEGGRGANANARLCVIADMSKLRVEVDINEQDLHRLSTDMPCRIIPESDRTRSYQGKVLWIDPQADYAKATVQLKVRIFDPDAALRVEGSAKVEFLGQLTAPQ